MPKEERRQSKRVLFTVEDGIVGVFNPPGNGGEAITANVMDISSGGVKLIFKPILENKIKASIPIYLQTNKLICPIRILSSPLNSLPLTTMLLKNNVMRI